jgi:erythromycin esterase-like protein
MNTNWMWPLFALVTAAPALGNDRAEWIREHAFPFDTVVPGAELDDLEPLKALIGDARIVSLGGSAHGSREISQMNHRMLEFLVTEMGFSVFSVEASMPESYAVGDYVRGGEGDAVSLIAGMYFWPWHTEEVLAMVEWMRLHNASGGDLDLTGFDMQTPDVAVANVLAFLADTDPGYVEEATWLYDGIEDAVAGGAFGVATATFPIEVARGHRVRFSADIKAELERGRAALWWRADGPNETLAFDNLGSGGAQGHSDWKRYSFELDVPEETININFGVLMAGDGRAWFDNLRIELDGEPYEDDTHFDLDFEDVMTRGFYTSSGVYAGQVVRDEHTTGEGCLRITHHTDVLLASVATNRAGEVLDHLRRLRPTLLRKGTSIEDMDWAVQNAQVVEQCMLARSEHDSLRDRYMADNVIWIAKHNPGAKIVLWAHNGRVGRRPDMMGTFLEEYFGDDHLSIGFATSRGEYVARNRKDGELGVHILPPPPDRSFEALLDVVGEPRLIVDLRGAVAGSPDTGWLREPVPFRIIGPVAPAAQFSRTSLAETFDAIVFIQRTTAARQLEWTTR